MSRLSRQVTELLVQQYIAEEEGLSRRTSREWLLDSPKNGTVSSRKQKSKTIFRNATLRLTKTTSVLWLFNTVESRFSTVRIEQSQHSGSQKHQSAKLIANFFSDFQCKPRTTLGSNHELTYHNFALQSFMYYFKLVVYTRPPHSYTVLHSGGGTSPITNLWSH